MHFMELPLWNFNIFVKIIKIWGHYVPKYGDPPFQQNSHLSSNMPSSQAATNGTAGAATGGAGATNGNGNMVHIDEEEERLVLWYSLIALKNGLRPS